MDRCIQKVLEYIIIFAETIDLCSPDPSRLHAQWPPTHSPTSNWNCLSPYTPFIVHKCCSS